MPPPRSDVRRAADRFRTDQPGIATAHSFSAGWHYDPTNTSYGLLVAHDEHVLQPGAGFADHPHRDLEIVTWVVSGALAHEDSICRSGTLTPGCVQRMSAGTGVVHSERNAATAPGGPPAHVVQAWLVPDVPDRAPSYAQLPVPDDRLRGRLTTVASGRAGTDEPAVRLGHRDAALHVTRLCPGQAVRLPAAPWVHVFVLRGAVELEDAGRLCTGDAARRTDGGGEVVTALESAEVLVWEMHAALGRP